MVQSTLKHTYISRRIENFILSLMFWGQNNDYDTVWLCVACFEGGRGISLTRHYYVRPPTPPAVDVARSKAVQRSPQPTNCQITFHYKCHLIWFHVLWQNMNLFHNQYESPRNSTFPWIKLFWFQTEHDYLPKIFAGCLKVLQIWVWISHHKLNSETFIGQFITSDR